VRFAKIPRSDMLSFYTALQWTWPPSATRASFFQSSALHPGRNKGKCTQALQPTATNASSTSPGTAVILPFYPLENGVVLVFADSEGSEFADTRCTLHFCVRVHFAYAVACSLLVKRNSFVFLFLEANSWLHVVGRNDLQDNALLQSSAAPIH
jgi:hypothetical protein